MCKILTFKRLKDISLLKTNGYIEKNINREQYKVCIIDNDGYDSMGLELSGYKNITIKTKYENPNDFSAYNIIACDIDGVGEKVDPKKQGIAVAEVLKKTYPDKIVMICSSNNPFEYDEHFYLKSDGFFKKSDAASEIANRFDELIRGTEDPICSWKSIEKMLRGQDIPNKTIAYLEDKYVDSLLKKENLFKSEKTKISKALKITCDIILYLAKVISLFIV